jgi:hypothetical protein
MDDAVLALGATVDKSTGDAGKDSEAIILGLEDEEPGGHNQWSYSKDLRCDGECWVYLSSEHYSSTTGPSTE